MPDAGELWTPFLERAGGIAPDLPGFGASAKRGDLDYSIDGYADWLERFCALAGLDDVRLVLHDWGAVGLAWAQRRPERVRRLVAIDAVPFLPGYRWHPIARVWRTPVLGEVAMGMAVGPVVRRLLPAGRARAGPRRLRPRHPARDPAAVPREPAGRARRGGTAARRRSRRRRWCCTAERDRYIPARFADGLAAALGDGRVEHVAGAGHWPWLDRPELVGRITDFLGL